MREILVDTNVLISYLTDRDKDQERKAAALFQAAAAREHTLALHSIAIVEMVYVLTQLYKADPLDVAETVRKLFEMPGVISVSDINWRLVLERWPETIPSLGDAILAAVASEPGYDAVATFDGGLRTKLVKQGCVSYW